MKSTHRIRVASIEKEEVLTADQLGLKLAKEQEAARFADPTQTAVIVPMDDKTNAIRWRKADRLMNSL
jgi:hypothetical protein